MVTYPHGVHGENPKNLLSELCEKENKSFSEFESTNTMSGAAVV